MQLSAIPVPVVYTPVQPVAPVGGVKRDDGAATVEGASQKPRATPPPGVGTLLDIDA
ncbi:MAG TPA: hypothetical protein VFE18_07645 [Phenylobacterium sp.]|uniref:hypothetical protein n=1 Tax=Phenylobacterium sp. TaxID=1871053 RepID=UPI002D4B578E|nr:hypothetical protein [Phenylobacterium sp.]HZZ68032.1 hypothetical protein [Phenylobacterium sp.]